MNSDWHKKHVLAKGASLDQRLAWHLEHQKRCACRPLPPKLRQQRVVASSEEREPAIDEYLARQSPTNRALLEELRRTIHAVVPEVDECIRYRMPAFRLQGSIIAGFSGTRKGCSYYPFSGTTLETLAVDISGYSQTKSALHFGPDRPLRKSVVRKLLMARIAEVLSGSSLGRRSAGHGIPSASQRGGGPY
jgi:uncharacterized protein YdhG (YjbR/CyaY superfamily)